MFQSLCEYGNAKDYLETAPAISIETVQGSVNGKLGTAFESLCEYGNAKEYLEKALTIRIEIGDRAGQAADYGNLGIVFHSLCEYGKAREYLEKSVAIRIEIGDRKGEASCYGNLGAVFKSVGEYDNAKKYLEKALAIRIEVGDRAGQAADYCNLGTVFFSLGEYDKAKDYFDKALAMSRETGDREEVCYRRLGTLFQSLGEYDKAEDYFERTLSISRDIGTLDKEIHSLCNLTVVQLSQGKMQEAFDCLLLSMDKSESLRGFQRDNDEFKISFSDVHNFPYRNLSLMYCFSGNSNKALYVLELARARASADLMTTQYSIKWQISANPTSWFGIENILKKERNCTCLYISYYAQFVFLWILKTSGVIHFRTKKSRRKYCWCKTTWQCRRILC